MAQDPAHKPIFDLVVGPVPDGEQGVGAAAPLPPAGNPHELLTRGRVDVEYGIPTKALERYAWAGGGPPMVKLGHRTVRYRRGDIEAFISAHVVDGQG